MPQPENNYLSTTDIFNLLNLADFTPIKREWRQLIPKKWFGLGYFINRFIATLPGIRLLCLRNYVVTRINVVPPTQKPSTTVVVTCRNERGNIEPAIQRIPKFCDDLEIIFVEGGSTDGTLEEIHRVIKAYPQYNIKVFVQEGTGKEMPYEKDLKKLRMIFNDL